MSDAKILPQRRLDAANMGSDIYNTGKPCKHGHFADRRTITGECMECRRLAPAKDQRKVREILARAKASQQQTT